MGTTVNVKNHDLSFRDTNEDHMIDLESDVFTLEGEKISPDDPRLADFDRTLQKKLGVNLSNGLKVSTLQVYVNHLRRSEVECSSTSSLVDTHRVFGPLFDFLESYNEALLNENKQGYFIPGINKMPETTSQVFQGVANMLGLFPTVTDEEASEAYERREVALQALRDVIEMGLSNNETWVSEGGLEAALKKLPADQQNVLTQQLQANQFNKVITPLDPKDLLKKIENFRNSSFEESSLWKF